MGFTPIARAKFDTSESLLTHSTLIHPSNETRQGNIVSISKASNIESTHVISLLHWIEPTMLSSKHQQTFFNSLSTILESGHQTTSKRLLIILKLLLENVPYVQHCPSMIMLTNPFASIKMVTQQQPRQTGLYIDKKYSETTTETNEIICELLCSLQTMTLAFLYPHLHF